MCERDQIRRWLDEADEPSGTPDPSTRTRALRAPILHWIHGVQPFFVPSDEADACLERLLADLVGDLRGTLFLPSRDTDLSSLTDSLERFARELSAWVGSLPLGASRGPGLVVAAEYSPELQLRVLGLEPGSMKEPILDLGCGEQARLVGYLRAHGKAAVGIDRYSFRAEGARVADWFSLPLLHQSWGTVIAHQSFSLHFLHHHLSANGDAERYASRYMEILQALCPGGVFVYAPGLPFLELLLPRERYRVTRRALAIAPPAGTPLAEWLEILGESPLYASRVEPVDT
jgi:hypothetical protein